MFFSWYLKKTSKLGLQTNGVTLALSRRTIEGGETFAGNCSPGEQSLDRSPDIRVIQEFVCTLPAKKSERFVCAHKRK